MSTTLMRYRKHPPKMAEGCIILWDKKREYVIPLKKIAYLAADTTYTHIHLRNGDHYMDSRTIKLYEEQLVSLGFFRIHKSFVVNMSYVATYTKGRGGTLTLRDGTMLPVAQNRKTAFTHAFHEYLKKTRTFVIFQKNSLPGRGRPRAAESINVQTAP